ncbi:MAG: PQQ-binding-like beta-propeller repeat protein [Planctomycetaceae bacterium]|nr:PQQ-binding-like beta-propeller repeat protein [Planctomycetaceae bacterium]
MSWCLLCLLGFSTTALNAAENWPEFRGPLTNGQAPDANTPVRWSETENIAWKTPLVGRAWSSPVVWGNQIWLTNGTPDGKELFAVCLDRNTGEVLLNRKQFDLDTPPEIHKFNSYSSPSPVIEEGRVYLSWGSYGLACVDTVTMETVWQRRDLECDHYRGPGSSPILFGDLLIEHYDGYDYQYVIALNKQTGDTVWRTKRPHNFGTDNGDLKKAYATPIIIDVNGQLQLISPTSKGTFAYNPQTGEEIWRITYDGFSTPCRPLYDKENGLVIIATGFSKGAVLAVRPDGQGDITESHIAWFEKRGMPSKPSPLLIDGLLYTIEDKGVASCLDVKTGEVVWQERIGGNYSASPIFAGGHIYLFSEDGKATVFKPGREYVEVAVNQFEDGFMSSPAVTGNALILRTTEAVYRVEATVAAKN